MLPFKDLLLLSMAQQCLVKVLQIDCRYHLPYPNPKSRIAPKREEYSQSINKLGFVVSVQVVVHSGGALAVVSIALWEQLI